MTATAGAASSAPEAVRTAVDQSFWGQVFGIVAYGGMSWANVRTYPQLGDALGAAFIAFYLGAVLNIIVVAERHQEAESR